MNSKEKNTIAPKPIPFEQRAQNILKHTLKQTVLLNYLSISVRNTDTFSKLS